MRPIDRCLEEMSLESLDEWFDMGMEENGPFDSVQWGACTKRDCDGTALVEPDQRHGYCPECEDTTVESLGSLAGIC